MREDMMAYFFDLLFLHTDIIAVKTAEFIKRNWLRFASCALSAESMLYKIWVAVKHGAIHVWHGLQQFFRDGTWAVKEQGSKFTSRYDDVSYSKQTKIRQVKKDFIKFVPFSFFLIVPGAELALPAWIMIFPNSIPSQFLSDKERE